VGNESMPAKLMSIQPANSIMTFDYTNDQYRDKFSNKRRSFNRHPVFDRMRRYFTCLLCITVPTLE